MIHLGAEERDQIERLIVKRLYGNLPAK